MDLADLADIHIEAELQAALDRHARPRGDGRRYLHCTECNAEIPEERRELVPHVSTCVHCTEILESVRGIGKNAGTWWW